MRVRFVKLIWLLVGAWLIMLSAVLAAAEPLLSDAPRPRHLSVPQVRALAFPLVIIAWLIAALVERMKKAWRRRTRQDARSSRKK